MVVWLTASPLGFSSQSQLSSSTAAVNELNMSDITKMSFIIFTVSSFQVFPTVVFYIFPFNGKGFFFQFLNLFWIFLFFGFLWHTKLHSCMKCSTENKLLLLFCLSFTAKHVNKLFPEFYCWTDLKFSRYKGYKLWITVAVFIRRLQRAGMCCSELLCLATSKMWQNRDWLPTLAQTNK